MAHWRRIAGWGGALFGLLIFGVVFALLLIDWGRLGPWVATRATATIGREVRVETVDIEWSWRPLITIKGLTVANADWAEEDLLADIAEARLRISIPALLRWRLELPELTLIRPVLSLEQNEEGLANWDFATGQAAADAAAPDHRGEMPLIGRLRIEEGRLTYRDPRRGIDLKSRLSTAAVSGSEHLRLAGDGTVEGKPFKMTLEGGSLLALREGRDPYPLRLDLSAGGTELRLDGTMREPVRLEGADLALELSGPDLAEIFPLFGIPTPTTAPYRLSGQLQRNDGNWRVEGLRGRVGESDLSGWVAIAPREEVPLIEAELHSQQLRLIDLGGLIGLDPGKEDPTASVAPPGKVLPDVPVTLERLRAADMNIRFEGDAVEVPDLPLREVDFHLQLEGGRAQLNPLRFVAQIGEIAGQVTLDGRQDNPRGDFDLSIRNLGLQQFLGGTRFAAETDGMLAGRIRLTGHGRSLSKILGSADGDAMLVMEGGRISHLLVELAGLDVAEGLAMLVQGDKPIAARCLVADFAAQKGHLGARTLVLDTTDTNITGRLSLDLGLERLEGRLVPEPKDFSPLSARVPIIIGGTFADPTIGVEKGPLAGKGAAAAALGVFLTPLAAIIPFLDAGGGEDSPCRSLIQQAKAKGAGK